VKNIEETPTDIMATLDLRFNVLPEYKLSVTSFASFPVFTTETVFIFNLKKGKNPTSK